MADKTRKVYGVILNLLNEDPFFISEMTEPYGTKCILAPEDGRALLCTQQTWYYASKNAAKKVYIEFCLEQLKELKAKESFINRQIKKYK